VSFTTPDGEELTTQAEAGETVLQVALENLIPGIIGECSGNLSCATCHVYVDDAWIGSLPAKSPDEEEMLENASEEPTASSRLCCQISITDALDGLHVRIPASQR
jgi:2Fe-2S ferredoxin